MRDSQEDLSARARRGALDEGEQRRLKMLLDASVEGRLLHRAGCDFDREDSVLTGDDAIAARIAERVMRGPTQGGRRRRPRWILVAIAACFVAVGATASVATYRHRLAVLHAQERPLLESPAVPPAASTSRRPREPESVENALSETSIPEQPIAPAPVSAPAPAASASLAPELFASAARARRDGDIEEAVRLYGALQRRYPTAPESRAADIALAMLQLGRGANASSLEHFQRYLRHSPGGDLVPEALWGQAETLKKLGRSGEAKQSLEALVARFPDSTYASVARARLAKSTP